MNHYATHTSPREESAAVPAGKVTFADAHAGQEQEGIASAKYVEGGVGLARGAFKKLRRLKTSYRDGVLVVNLSDGGSLSFYKDFNLSDFSNLKVAKSRLSRITRREVSVRARMEEFAAPTEKPYLFIPAIVPWTFDADGGDSFQIVVPPSNGKMDFRVESTKYGYAMKKKLSTNRNDDDSNSTHDGSVMSSSSSIKKNSQVFLFWCHHPGELAVYATAAESLHRNNSQNISELKCFIVPKTNVRAKTAAAIQIAAQNALIGRTESVRHVLTRRMSGIGVLEYRCFPLYCYPAMWMSKEDVVVELTRTSKEIHDLRSGTPDEIGSLKVEVLQCSGLPKLDKYSLTDAYCFIVCGSSSFITDVIPENCNPCWLPRSRRACVMPIHNAYSQCFIGVFDYDGEKAIDDFAGRVVIDINRLHSGASIDVTLPLRECSRVHKRKCLGSIRLRLQLDWAIGGERAAMLSYLPKNLSDITKRIKSPSIPVTVKCPDSKSFLNIATTVYGKDIPGRYSKSMQTAVTREIVLIKKMLLYHTKRTAMDIFKWRTPLLSAYLFCGWMHFVVKGISLLPAFILSLLFIFMVKNYLQYHVNSTAAKIFGYRSIGRMARMLLFSQCDTNVFQKKKNERNGIPLLDRALYGIFGIHQINTAAQKDSWQYDDHAEFPFSIGSVDKKMSSDEAAARPNWEAAQNSKNQFQSSQDDDDDGDEISIDFSTSSHRMDDFDSYGESFSSLGSVKKTKFKVGDLPFKTGSLQNKGEKKQAPSPKSVNANIDHSKQRFPDQNVRTKSEGGKVIQKQVDDWHRKSQKIFLFLFDDRVFIADDTTDAQKVLLINAGRNPISRRFNPLAAQMIKFFDIPVSAFRAVFNILFWKDPILSFWALLFVFCLMIVFIIFPWRTFFFTLGLLGLGPQNYFLVDWYKQKKDAQKSDLQPLDESIKSIGSHQENQHGSVNGGGPASPERPINNDQSNSQLLFRNNLKMRPDGKLREVIVPSIPFRYNRFYDWPPEPALVTIKYSNGESK